MMIRRQQGENAAPLVSETDKMAATLEAQHGVLAAEIAEFFSTLQVNRGNALRACAWASVANAVRRRTEERTKS